jgi:hypothetical protein
MLGFDFHEVSATGDQDDPIRDPSDSWTDKLPTQAIDSLDTIHQVLFDLRFTDGHYVLSFLW